MLSGALEHRPYRASEAKNWFVVSLALILMIYTGSKALQYLSVPVFTIFKNLTIILIAYSERILLNGNPVTPLMLISFGLIVLSSVVAGWADISDGHSLKNKDASVAVSYGWMIVNCLTTAAFNLLMKSRIRLTRFSDFDTVFYNNLLSIPVLLVLSLMTELDEASKLYTRYWSDDDTGFYGLLSGILISGATSFGISYATPWCIRVTSSTTYR